ncbi:GIY-YIG nuclease family protein [uncultured Marinobacter sp.]|uniref:GIY-YIG nuclease family protein n=1 Tax=uncultured Marinobacter sp. TaxID=187379 RepID=UPI0030DDA127
MARQTKAGYVYVISNPASFADGICKIGMTRRLDPNDRVKELGDASVPDLFQVHAFIYTDDAPMLEKYFHDHFSEHRVNLVNRRKEFLNIESEATLKALKQYLGPYTVKSFDEEIPSAPTGENSNQRCN